MKLRIQFRPELDNAGHSIPLEEICLNTISEHLLKGISEDLQGYAGRCLAIHVQPTQENDIKFVVALDGSAEWVGEEVIVHFDVSTDIPDDIGGPWSEDELRGAWENALDPEFPGRRIGDIMEASDLFVYSLTLEVNPEISRFPIIQGI